MLSLEKSASGAFSSFWFCELPFLCHGTDVLGVIFLATGTDLTAATHVILIDPVAGSKQEANDIEAQASKNSASSSPSLASPFVRLRVTFFFFFGSQLAARTVKVKPGNFM